MPTVGNVIARLRADAGLTRTQLARLAGVSPEYIRRLEAGDYQKPSLVYLTKLADALGVTIDELAGPHKEPRVALPYLAHQEVFRLIQTQVKPEDIPAFAEMVREWVEWSDEFRGTVIVLGQMAKPKRGKR